MRRLIIPLLASIIFTSCEQRTANQSGTSGPGIDSIAQGSKVDSFRFEAKPDSIIGKHQEGYIYITTDTSSRLYDWIIPSPHDKYVAHIFADYINHIKKEYEQKIVTHDLKGFPRKWNSVYTQNGQYYLYAPSDWMSNRGYFISDSVVYITKSDPNDLYAIRAIEMRNPKSITLKTINYTGDHKTITVQRVDADYGVYVWTFLDKQNQMEDRYLMQDSDFARKLPMIVCDCGDEKCVMEFEFDAPNFQTLVGL